MKKLRVSHLIVQPVLVWDDGEELSPGPVSEPQQIPLSSLAGLPEQLRESCRQAEEHYAEEGTS